MPKFPEPPPAEELESYAPEIEDLTEGSLLFRLYKRGGSHPTHWNSFRKFGPLNGRFDPHLPGPEGRAQEQDRSVLYCASNGVTCIAEFFQDTRLIDRKRDDPWLVAFPTARRIQLLNLRGAWPTRVGASMKISSGPRPRARRWAREIYAAYPKIDGLLYSSSMYKNHPAWALWDRARSALPPEPLFHRALRDHRLTDRLKNVAREIGYGLV